MKKIVFIMLAGAMMVTVLSCENKERIAYVASIDSLQIAYDSVGQLATNWKQQFEAAVQSCNADTAVSDSVKALAFEKVTTDWSAFEAEWATQKAALDSLQSNTEEMKAEEVDALVAYLDGVDEKLAAFQSQMEEAKVTCRPAVVTVESAE